MQKKFGVSVKCVAYGSCYTESSLFFSLLSHSISRAHLRGDPGGTPYNGLYAETLPEGGTLFRFQVYERVGISRAEVHVRVRKSDIRWIKD